MYGHLTLGLRPQNGAVTQWESAAFDALKRAIIKAEVEGSNPSGSMEISMSRKIKLGFRKDEKYKAGVTCLTVCSHILYGLQKLNM